MAKISKIERNNSKNNGKTQTKTKINEIDRTSKIKQEKYVIIRYADNRDQII